MKRSPAAYWNPYLAGLALGGVLTGSFLLTGRGLGVSGALSDLVRSVLPFHGPISLAGDSMISELLGLVVGAAISGALAGRTTFDVSGGSHISGRSRLSLAVLGGMLVGIGSRFAHGCTSGQALSGGALLSVGSWVFMLTLFAAAYAMAGIMRRSWT